MTKNKYVRFILCVIISLIFLSVLVPLVVEFLVFRNSFYSAISNSDWSSFLGSYLGGVIGGTATMIAVYYTLVESKTETHKNEMESIIAVCVSFIQTYNLTIEVLEHIIKLEKCKKAVESEINEIDKNLYGLVAPTEEARDELQEIRNQKQNDLNRMNSEFDSFLRRIERLRNNLSKYVLLTDIKTSDIVFAEALMNSLKQGESEVKTILGDSVSYNENRNITDYIDIEKLTGLIKNIQNNVQSFVNQYKDMYIIYKKREGKNNE